MSGPLFTPLADGSVPSGCAFPPPGGRLAEWHADGDVRNAEPCSPWTARIVGAVPYGPGRHGEAWYFRSKATSGAGDPHYVAVSGAAGAVLPHVTVDAWVRQGPFNAYRASNRYIVGTGWKDFPSFRPGEFLLYVHENQEVYFFMKVGRTFTSRVDWATCPMEAGKVPLDTWVRYTGTYDGGVVRCYKNGALVSAIDLPAQAPAGPIDDLVIGRNYPGDVDEIRIFAAALAPADLARPWP